MATVVMSTSKIPPAVTPVGIILYTPNNKHYNLHVPYGMGLHELSYKLNYASM